MMEGCNLQIDGSNRRAQARQSGRAEPSLQGDRRWVEGRGGVEREKQEEERKRKTRRIKLSCVGVKAVYVTRKKREAHRGDYATQGECECPQRGYTMMQLLSLSVPREEA